MFKPGGEYYLIPLELIVPSTQKLRLSIDEKRIGDLARTFAAQDIHHYPVVFQRSDGKCELVLGFRRCMAAKKAGKPVILCRVIREKLSEADKLRFILTENMQREDFKAVEIVEGITRLHGYGISQVTIARDIGCNPSFVSRAVAIRKLLSDEEWKEIQELATSQDISFSVLHEASKIQDPDLRKHVLTSKLTVREIRELLKRGQKLKMVKPKQILKAIITNGLVRASLSISGMPNTREEVYSLASSLAEEICQKYKL